MKKYSKIMFMHFYLIKSGTKLFNIYTPKSDFCKIRVDFRGVSSIKKGLFFKKKNCFFKIFKILTIFFENFIQKTLKLCLWRFFKLGTFFMGHQIYDIILKYANSLLAYLNRQLFWNCYHFTRCQNHKQDFP